MNIPVSEVRGIAACGDTPLAPYGTLLRPSASTHQPTGQTKPLVIHSARDLVGQRVAMQKSWASPACNGLRAAAKTPPLRAQTVCKRGLQDVSITRTGRPIIRVQGGR